MKKQITMKHVFKNPTLVDPLPGMLSVPGAVDM